MQNENRERITPEPLSVRQQISDMVNLLSLSENFLEQVKEYKKKESSTVRSRILDMMTEEIVKGKKGNQ